MEPDLSLHANLRRLAVLVKDWQGEFIDSASTVSARNPEAVRVPVYWCFNSAKELDLLEQEFGPDQTLVGMRSLNSIVRVVPELSHVLDPLARHYADALLSRFGRRPCIVGGNCQAAGIAWRVANFLMAAGVPVQRLVVLEAEPRVPFMGTLRLLFGAQSHTHNPFLRPPIDPARPIPWHWDRAWRRFETRIISGGHGEYFRPRNLPDLARGILEPDRSVQSSSDTDILLPDSLAITCKTVGASQSSTTVEVATPPGFPHLDNLGLMTLWRKRDGSLMATAGPDWIAAVDAAPVWQRTFANPFNTVEAALIPILCLAGHGPVQWPKELQGPATPTFDQTD